MNEKCEARSPISSLFRQTEESKARAMEATKGQNHLFLGRGESRSQTNEAPAEMGGTHGQVWLHRGETLLKPRRVGEQCP